MFPLFSLTPRLIIHLGDQCDFNVEGLINVSCKLLCQIKNLSKQKGFDILNLFFDKQKRRTRSHGRTNYSDFCLLDDYIVNLKYIRKFIEGAFRFTSRLMPRKIHATTPQGFEIKIVGFLVAAAINF